MQNEFVDRVFVEKWRQKIGLKRGEWLASRSTTNRFSPADSSQSALASGRLRRFVNPSIEGVNLK